MKKKISKNEAILIALLDAQDNGDLIYCDDEDNDNQAVEFVNQEINRLSALVNVDKEYKEINKEPVILSDIIVNGNSMLINILVENNIEPSIGQAKKNIRLGINKIDDIIVSNEEYTLLPGIYLLSIGNRKKLKIIVKK